MKMKDFVLPDGEVIDVMTRGEGPDLLLIHGWTSGPHIWQSLLDKLSENYRVTMWRARGHRTTKPLTGTPIVIEQLAQDLNFLLDNYPIEKPVIVGHSMGAMLCWEFIKLFGESKASAWMFIDQSPCLVNKDSWPFSIYGNFSEEMNLEFQKEMKLNFAEAALKLAANGLNKEIKKAYTENTTVIQELRVYLKSLNHDAMRSLWKSFSVKDWREVVSKIQKPVALIYGDSSQFYSKEVASFVQDQLLWSHLEVVEGAHHSPQISKPLEFEKSFIRSLDAIRGQL